MSSTRYWLESSMRRVFPGSPALMVDALDMVAARNERTSFQACVRNESVVAVNVGVSVSAFDGLQVDIRRVGYVPVAHHSIETEESELDGIGNIPGYVPDPLYPEQTAHIGPYETQAFWITVSVPADIEPGLLELSLRFTDQDSGEELSELAVRLHVRPMVFQPRYDFSVTHWFYADALCDWYNVDPFDEGFWATVEPYMANLVGHGTNCLYVPLFTPPTDGVKRPTQLLKVFTQRDRRYAFDFSDVRRWVRLARWCGAESFEWTHLFSQWGAKHAIRVYSSNQDEQSLLWDPETHATSETYRNFLAQFLPEFREFLQSEDLLERSLFHLSDEPSSDEDLGNYRKARAMLSKLAPWMKIGDALSDVRYGKEGLTDIPIPIIDSARDYAEAGIPAWTYYCCIPRGRYLNRLMDTPLAKIRMSGWLFYRLGARGFLHWGYNYWYSHGTRKLIDPFLEQSAEGWPGWSYGDPFMVYPGPSGPIDSIRWEVFAESLQDYALLQAAGVKPDGELLSSIKGYDDFPKTEEWVQSARLDILGG